MAETPNLGLPLIDSNMTADVPRDVNALANAVDAAVGDMSSVPTAAKDAAGAISELHEAIGDNEAQIAQAASSISNLAGAGRTTQTVKGNADELAAHKADYVRQPGYGTTAGTATAYTLTLNPVPPALVAGLCVAVKVHVTSGANPTINVNGLGAKAIKKAEGNSVSLVSGGVYTMRYDGTAFILQGEGGEYGTASASQVLTGYSIGTANGIVAGTMPNRAGDTAALASSVSGTTLKLRASQGYRDGVDDNVTITDANFLAKFIQKDVQLFGLVGTLEPLNYALGSVSPTGSLPFSAYNLVDTTYAYVQVTGLAFKPKIIMIYNDSPSSTIGVYIDTPLFGNFGDGGVMFMRGGSTNQYKFLYANSFSVAQGSFILPCVWSANFKYVAMG